jgi:muramidase (phage lysozyme)
MRTAVIAASGLMLYAAWYSSNALAPSIDTAALGSDLTAALNPALDFLDFATGGILKLSNMRTVTAADLANKNVQAMLRVIRTGEGTADANGYRRIFGGQLFNSFADHPRVSVTSKNGYTSTAAGAYQALISTWDETRSIMGLKDFSPASQDLFAVGRIAARGALDDIKAGRFTLAIQKISAEWASMPFSTHGQPVISMEKANQIYTSNGGAIYA